jgi:hypothetical protein
MATDGPVLEARGLASEQPRGTLEEMVMGHLAPARPRAVSPREVAA